MSKKTFLISLIVYTVLFVLPPVVYLLSNFYIYLFNGWELSPKFEHGIGWLLVVSCGYVIFLIIYSENRRGWDE